MSLAILPCPDDTIHGHKSWLLGLCAVSLGEFLCALQTSVNFVLYPRFGEGIFYMLISQMYTLLLVQLFWTFRACWLGSKLRVFQERHP